MRKTRPTSETEFASVKLAFFHRITAWAEALERRDVAAARLELRHLDVLSVRVLQDELFVRAARDRDLRPEDLVGCLAAYLSAITDSMQFAPPAHTDEESEPSPEEEEE